MNHISLKKVGLNIMQSHCARSVSANTGPHQQRWGDWEMGLLSHAVNAVRWLTLSTHESHTYDSYCVHTWDASLFISHSRILVV